MQDFKHLILHNIAEFSKYFYQTDTLSIVVIDENLKISAHNRCFRTLISSGEDISGRPIHSFLLPESQALIPLSAPIRNQSVLLSFKSPESSPVPLKCKIIKINDGQHLIIGGHLMLTNEQILQQMTAMSNEMANMSRDLHRKNRELQEAHSKIKTLSGIVPICMHCKEIRDDKGYWNQLEKYITEHSDAHFSHGICDKCLKIHYPDLGL